MRPPYLRLLITNQFEQEASRIDYKPHYTWENIWYHAFNNDNLFGPGTQVVIEYSYDMARWYDIKKQGATH